MQEEKVRRDDGLVLGLADKGYKGIDLHTHSSSRDTAEVREFKSRALAHHENFNGLITKFEVLKQEFRHDLEKHSHCFEPVVVICHYCLEHGSSLLTV